MKSKQFKIMVILFFISTSITHAGFRDRVGGFIGGSAAKLLQLPGKSFNELQRGLGRVGIDISKANAKIQKINKEVLKEIGKANKISYEALNALTMGTIDKTPVINTLNKQLQDVLLQSDKSDKVIVDYKTSINEEIDNLEELKQELIKDNDIINVTHGIAAYFQIRLYNNHFNYDELEDFMDLSSTYFLVTNLYTQFTGTPITFSKRKVLNCFEGFEVNIWSKKKIVQDSNMINRDQAFDIVYTCLFKNSSKADFLDRDSATSHYELVMDDPEKSAVYTKLEKYIHVYSNYEKKLIRGIDKKIQGYKNISRKTDALLEEQKELRYKMKKAEAMIEKLRQ